MPVKLHHQSYGDSGKNTVILHGLLGMGRNWAGIARRLGEKHRVFTPDLRNHGSSGHSDEFTYGALVEDLLAWSKEQEIEQAVWVGHSLGGKTVMKLCHEHPEMVEGVVIVDVSPCPSPPRWIDEFAAMRALDLDALKSRQEAEEQLQASGIEGWAFRKFLVSNLERDADGTFRWRVNLRGLEASLENVFASPVTGNTSYTGPSMLIRGGDSEFVPDADIPVIESHFPLIRIETVAEAGHNVHADKPDRVLNLLEEFLGDNL